MNFKSVSVCLGLIAGGLLTLAAPASAFSGFTFGTEFSPKDFKPKEDIWLESVTLDVNGITTTIDADHLSLVRRASILNNALTTEPNGQTGPGSSDRGDNATGVVAGNPTNQQIAQSLGNLNLNNIIDTEDSLGESELDIFFDQRVDTLFFYERGLNSDLRVQAIYADGTLGEVFEILGNVPRRSNVAGLWQNAGYRINTTEIEGAQNVGSYGLKSDRLLKGVRLYSGIGDNGPDYKVFGTRTSVPEPATLAGLGAVAGVAFLTRRRATKQA